MYKEDPMLSFIAAIAACLPPAPAAAQDTEIIIQVPDPDPALQHAILVIPAGMMPDVHDA